MISPTVTDQKQRADATDGLRVLVAELRSLVDRLDLKERSHNLQSTLKTAEQRLAGPRAVVMLLSEHEELKRRFLERLLGPKLTQVPKPTTACIRLEYGIAPECSVSIPLGLTAAETPGRIMETIRLPNPTLKSGVALIDTPVLAGSEPDATTLEYAEEADAWILVLNADHALSEASLELLRRLPDSAARLEIVVENADGLSNEERLAARDRLINTLRERCKVEAPRLTLVASTATEGDGASFWHGRFATFHSVMMLRGREHWLKVTRTMVSDALSEVNAEIEFALKSIPPGLREGRLRLGMKDLEELRMRFDAIERLESERPQETGVAEAAPKALEAAPSSNRSGPGAVQVGGAAQAAGADPSTMTSPEPIANAALVSDDATNALTRLRPGKTALLKRAGGVSLAIALVCLIAWALAPRVFFFGRESGAEWDYHPPTPAPVNHAAPAVGDANLEPPKPADLASLPETSRPAAPNISEVPPVKRRTHVRLPLPHPIPSGATAGVAPPAKRHRRHLLGLGKLWHWVRHDHGQHDTKTD
jgi:hypothetical protein